METTAEVVKKTAGKETSFIPGTLRSQLPASLSALTAKAKMHHGVAAAEGEYSELEDGKEEAFFSPKADLISVQWALY